jgi:transposase
MQRQWPSATCSSLNAIVSPASKKRGPAPQTPDARDKKIGELERETARWRTRAERAEALVEVQKKLAVLLGTPLESERS